ncbi:MAG: AEC family transporter [Eubacterium sp.]|nr:AEC family transporter [Eubacterium sp.]
MNLSLMLTEQILIMAVLMLFGYLSVRFHVLKGEDSRVISSMVLYVISPAMVFDSFLISFSMEKLLGFLLALGASTLMHILFLIFTRLLGRFYPMNSVEKASIVYSNCGNLLVPMIGAILGREYVLYCCAFMSVQGIVLWTHGAYILGGRDAVSLKKFFLNPNIIAMFLGLLFFFTGLRLPAIPGSAIEKTGACIAPVSMFIIGMLIASADLKAIFTKGRSWIICAVRLIVIPLLTILMLFLLHIPSLIKEGPSILYVSFLASAAPVAVNVTQLANLYGEDSVLASSINIMSVFLCIITMPLMTMVYQLLFL